MANFDHAINLLLGDPSKEDDGLEGGYVKDENDPGGETKFGISKRSYPDLDIANLTEADARDIYARDFWARIKGDRIQNQWLASMLFDMAVHLGRSKAIRLAQEVCGLDVDGVMGPRTLEALNTTHDVLAWLALRRIREYHSIVRNRPASRKYLFNWVHRALVFVET